MLQKKAFISRSTMDRRLSLNRRILNLGPRYPDKEQRMKQDRRQGWEDRVEWQRSNQWDSILNALIYRPSEWS